MTVRVALLCVCLAALGACADPARRATDYAKAHGFEEDVIAGTVFRHQVFRAHTESPNGAALHVYIDGDGRPFIDETRVTDDPTPRHPIMLHLMALDPSPSVYLGRPCYFGLQNHDRCAPIYWTLRRFSPEVVDSMRAAMVAEAARSHAAQIELYAHSGGATLAVLLAARVPMVTRVVTIGADLDTDAWCALHGYTPLAGSLNPIKEKGPPARVAMLHLVGSQDQNTPVSLVQDAVRGGVGGTVRVVSGYTHSCCWQNIWPEILNDR